MEITQLCQTLCRPQELQPSRFPCPWNSSGWSGLPFPSLGDFSDRGIEPEAPALAGRFFTI